MLVKTRGVVLGFIKYKETSVIVNIYTEALGLKSYIVNGVRDKKNKIVFFQPLTLLDLVAYNNSKGLNRLSEYRIHKHYSSILFNQKKIAVLLFLSELLHKTLKEEHPEEELFCFIADKLSAFDDANENFEDFHLLFLLEFAGFLGIKPSSADDIEKDFGAKIDKEVALLLDDLLQEDIYPHMSLSISGRLRRETLEVLVDYFEHHFPFIGKIESMAILKEVFS